MLLVLNSLENCKIFNLFYENDICLRCIFRLFKIDKIDFYRDKEKFIELLNTTSISLNLKNNLLENYDFKNLIRKDKALQEGKTNICNICLGILQLVDHEEKMNEIINLIKQEGYEFSSFKFTMKIPLSAALRAFHVLFLIQLLKNYLR